VDGWANLKEVAQMIESIIWFLIYVLIIAGLLYLVFWVITTVAGVPIPAKIIQIVWVIFALIVVLLLIKMFIPYLGSHGHLLR
jgi:hypothetical protein